ncbi:hypothetical protein [Peptoniphilus indolicus]|uniref:Uncharacterized protein n=1 Tax=Peptoniphilus indolicus TaxID=33030 RepID=A0A379EEH7_9FIRM|nr:hypothetical protein [Peptoniphilus indolicus]SUB94789.1 Uncharacterised protein [Peptoniphilus indolicus]
MLGNDIIAYGENLRVAWKCVCGAVNPSDVQECRHCHRNKYFVLNNLTESLVNMKILNMLSQTINFSEAGKKALTENLTKTHLTKIAPSTDVLATTRINEDEDKSKSKNKVLTNTLLVTVSLIIFILISHLIMNFNQSNNFYKAKDYIAKGKYQEAVQLLEKYNLQINLKLNL